MKNAGPDLLFGMRHALSIQSSCSSSCAQWIFVGGPRLEAPTMADDRF